MFLFFIGCNRKITPFPNSTSTINGINLNEGIEFHKKYYYIKCINEDVDICYDVCVLSAKDSCSILMQNRTPEKHTTCFFSNVKDIEDMSEDELHVLQSSQYNNWESGPAPVKEVSFLKDKVSFLQYDLYGHSLSRRDYFLLLT